LRGQPPFRSRGVVCTTKVNKLQRWYSGGGVWLPIKLIRNKIRRRVVTRIDLNCEGRIHISEALIEATTIHPFAAQKRNLNNSRRIETYTLPSPRDSGEICMNRA